MVRNAVRSPHLKKSFAGHCKLLRRVTASNMPHRDRDILRRIQVEEAAQSRIRLQQFRFIHIANLQLLKHGAQTIFSAARQMCAYRTQTTLRIKCCQRLRVAMHDRDDRLILGTELG